MCPSGWERYDGRCWLFSQSAAFSGSRTLLFTDAQSYCATQSAALATIFTPRENCYLGYGIPGNAGNGCFNYKGSGQAAGSYSCHVGLTQTAGSASTAYSWVISPDSRAASTLSLIHI